MKVRLLRLLMLLRVATFFSVILLSLNMRSCSGLSAPFFLGREGEGWAFYFSDSSTKI